MTSNPTLKRDCAKARSPLATRYVHKVKTIGRSSCKHIHKELVTTYFNYL